jgi:hypothetical protein
MFEFCVLGFFVFESTEQRSAIYALQIAGLQTVSTQ